MPLSSLFESSAALWTAVAVAILVALVVKYFSLARPAAASAPATCAAAAAGGGCACAIAAAAAPYKGPTRRLTIIYATQKGTARTLAHKLFSAILACRIPAAAMADPVICDAAAYEPENLSEEDIVVFVVSSYAGGSAPEGCENFAQILKDMGSDFRYGPSHMPHVRFAIFGLGDMVYGVHFNAFAKMINDAMRGLGASSLAPPMYASEARVAPLFALFIRSVTKFLVKKAFGKGGLRGGDDDGATSVATTSVASSHALRHPAASAAAAAGDSDVDSAGERSNDDDDDNDEGAGADDDIEDLVATPSNELIYPRLRTNLEKQGYQLIGSHSGVKLCRWNKSMLRGRGGCYKHTFYDISSFQCMEMTPSLACANKCVFCWRHHTNPVAKEFTWKMDAPDFLVDTAIAVHRGMLRQMKGVPGVQPDRLAEAMNVRHCALSLVGEPIIYPAINEFTNLLHQKHISTFMVTNAQFPERIRQLAPVTQLYVSIDAATKEELRRIDRPIFDDFWERMNACVREIALKRQRTVFRLTLVNEYNISNVHEYGNLIRTGNPDFIEVKGVTFCGASEASPLTMKSVPFHHEVVEFCRALVADILPENYEIASEHAHSCCMLIAKKKFFFNNAWHTWIDYPKFFALVESGRTDFTSLEYAAATPAWAVFGSDAHGFDPVETRHEGKGKKKGQPVQKGC